MYISASSSLLPISTTNTETRILSSAFATSSCSGRRRFSGNKNVLKSNFHRGSKSPQRCFPTSASASSSSSQDSTMTPIQLQDVARKQFENRERSRAQMVRQSFTFSFFSLCLTGREGVWENCLTQHENSSSYLNQKTGGTAVTSVSIGNFRTAETRENAV